MTGSFSYTPKQTDLLTAFKLHYPPIQPKRIARFLAFCAFIGLAVAIMAGDTKGIEWFQVIGGMMVFGLIIMSLIQILVQLLWMPRYTRRIFAQQVELQQQVEVIWNEAGFSTTTAKSHAQLDWKDFFGWARNGKVMMLYRSEAMFNYFPTDTAEKIAAADAIEAHLIKAGVKRRA